MPTLNWIGRKAVDLPLPSYGGHGIIIGGSRRSAIRWPGYLLVEEDNLLMQYLNLQKGNVSCLIKRIRKS